MEFPGAKCTLCPQRQPKLQARDAGIWWGTLGKLQLMLRKAAKALYAVGPMIDMLCLCIVRKPEAYMVIIYKFPTKYKPCVTGVCIIGPVGIGEVQMATFILQNKIF